MRPYGRASRSRLRQGRRIVRERRAAARRPDNNFLIDNVLLLGTITILFRNIVHVKFLLQSLFVERNLGIEKWAQRFMFPFLVVRSDLTSRLA